MAAKRTTAQGGFAQRNAAPDFARQTQKVGPMTARAVSPQAKRRRKPTSAGVRARGQPWNKGTYPGRPRGNMRGHIRAKRKWGSEHVAPSGATTGQPGFAAGEMRPNGSKGRVFAVGDPARQSRDGDGKILVRGDEVMAAKRTTAQGGFAQRNAAPDFARQTQKVGPVTVRAVSRSEMEPNGDKRRVVGRGATLERSESGVGQNIGAG